LDKLGRWVFWFEAIVINFGVGVMCFFAPALFSANFVPTGMPVLGNELIRWYGVLLWVLAYAGVRTLLSSNTQALAFVIEALLAGDLAHLAATGLYLRAGGAPGPGLLIGIGMSIFLAVVRALWLVNRREKALDPAEI
jgi:hypothetical protein